MNNIVDFLLDFIFPKHCVGCAQEGTWLCEDCKSKIIIIKARTCPKCKRLSVNGKLCANCRATSNLTGVIVAAHYKDGPLKEAIHYFKYEGIFDLKNHLGQLLLNCLKDKKFQCNFNLIAVPLHWKRFNERGFNQSELLANTVAQQTGLPVIKNYLVRKKYHIAQMKLSKKDRQTNISGAFAINCRKKTNLSGKNILLVDDVFTTGSTLEECARVLRQQGRVKEIWGLVLAKD